MLNNLLLAQQKGKDEENFIIFVLFLGSYESLCVISACIKNYGVGFCEKISVKTLLIYSLSFFSFSFSIFPKNLKVFCYKSRVACEEMRGG